MLSTNVGPECRGGRTDGRGQQREPPWTSWSGHRTAILGGVSVPGLSFCASVRPPNPTPTPLTLPHGVPAERMTECSCKALGSGDGQVGSLSGNNCNHVSVAAKPLGACDRQRRRNINTELRMQG